MSIVSVIMGVYRPPRAMLTKAVESVLEQTMPDLELIICDDGSRDGTYEILMELAEKDARMRILRHNKNLGLAAALNSCLEEAGGEYIARQDADDCSAPERFAAQTDFLRKNPDVDFVGSSIRLFDDSGVWAVKVFPTCPGKKDFLFSLPFSHGSLMFRRSVLQAHRYKVNRFTRRAEDYEMLMRMYADGRRGYNLDKPYYDYMEDGTSRKFRYRMDDVVIRARGFYKLGLLPAGIPYVLKPLAVGLIPAGTLRKMKKRYYRM